jgi:Uma2 family endonuclease
MNLQSLTKKLLPGTTINPLYPDTDGEPMSETDFHVAAVIWLREALQDHFANTPDVYVASNMLLYFQERNPSARRDPDVLVARGVGKHQRRSFRTFEEGTAPCVVFEIASEETWRRDREDKRIVYAQLGIAEYFLFDPEGVFFDPVLQGFRLQDGVYEPLSAAADGSLYSAELGLRLVSEGPMIRLIDARTGAPVLTRHEQAEQERQRAEVEQQRAEQERQRAEQERQRAQQERHRAEAEQQRAEQERQRAEEEKQRAEQERQRAEDEKQRADALAAEVARLRAQLGQSDPS